MGNIFKFKKFEVNQSGCAMKINTDGVLLGAVVVQAEPKRILDIGTGTGVIAMMLAQRFPDALVDAVEIDESAAQAAATNFKNSVFADRCTAHHSDILFYNTASGDNDLKYDLIVANPPYFINDLKNPEHRKGIARHTDRQFFDSMLFRVSELLKESGRFWFILPVKQAKNVIESAKVYGLSPAVLIHLHSDDQKPEFRQIVCLDYTSSLTDHQNLYIYKIEGVYTDTYKDLLRNFFLAF